MGGIERVGEFRHHTAGKKIRVAQTNRPRLAGWNPRHRRSGRYQRNLIFCRDRRSLGSATCEAAYYAGNFILRDEVGDGFGHAVGLGFCVTHDEPHRAPEDSARGIRLLGSDDQAI